MEPWPLVDEAELLFYELVIREFERQQGVVFDDVEASLSDNFWNAENILMAAAFAPFLMYLLAEVISLGLADYASVVSVDPVIENAELYATQFTGEFVGRINSVTRMQIQDILAESIREGWTTGQLTEALTPLFGDVRARLIAITETTNAYQGGAEFAVKELRNQGYDAVLVWVTVRDSHVCSICEPRDGKEQGAGWDDPGAAHPGCRCDVIIEIRD